VPQRRSTRDLKSFGTPDPATRTETRQDPANEPNLLTLDLSGRPWSAIIPLMVREDDRCAPVRSQSAVPALAARHTARAYGACIAPVYLPREARMARSDRSVSACPGLAGRRQFEPAGWGHSATPLLLTRFPLDFCHRNAIACLTTFIWTRRHGAAGTWGAHRDRRESRTEEWERACS
jgi:hypothetical protein